MKRAVLYLRVSTLEQTTANHEHRPLLANGGNASLP
jgi:DNA invertase Pin-like site-specific DNA recombinase